MREASVCTETTAGFAKSGPLLTRSSERRMHARMYVYKYTKMLASFVVLCYTNFLSKFLRRHMDHGICIVIRNFMQDQIK